MIDQKSWTGDILSAMFTYGYKRGPVRTLFGVSMLSLIASISYPNEPGGHGGCIEMTLETYG
jgi:hypothetical protein